MEVATKTEQGLLLHVAALCDRPLTLPAWTETGIHRAQWLQVDIQRMIRFQVPVLAVAVLGASLLAGCASRASAKAPHFARDSQFANEQQKFRACLDPRDHIVDLYATKYVVDEAWCASGSR